MGFHSHTLIQNKDDRQKAFAGIDYIKGVYIERIIGQIRGLIEWAYQTCDCGTGTCRAGLQAPTLPVP